MELNKHHYSLERVKCGLYKNLEQFSLMKMRTYKPISKRFRSVNFNTSFSAFFSSAYRARLLQNHGTDYYPLRVAQQACKNVLSAQPGLKLVVHSEQRHTGSTFCFAHYGCITEDWFKATEDWLLRNATPRCLGWSCVQHLSPRCHFKVLQRLCCPSSKSFLFIDATHLSLCQPCDSQNLHKTTSKTVSRMVYKTGVGTSTSQTSVG